jgi:hypothetical protein
MRSAAAVHKPFWDWHKVSSFLRLWWVALAEYDGLQSIGWEWQCKAAAFSSDVGT